MISASFCAEEVLGLCSDWAGVVGVCRYYRSGASPGKCFQSSFYYLKKFPAVLERELQSL